MSPLIDAFLFSIYFAFNLGDNLSTNALGRTAFGCAMSLPNILTISSAVNPAIPVPNSVTINSLSGFCFIVRTSFFTSLVTIFVPDLVPL